MAKPIEQAQPHPTSATLYAAMKLTMGSTGVACSRDMLKQTDLRVWTPIYGSLRKGQIAHFLMFL